jgi:secreted Zn-dependent insulinase-like peptidase
MMTPQRVHIDVASPKFAVVEGESTVLGVVLDREEKHFGTRYTVGSLSDETLTLWSKPPVLDSLHLPHRNPFMPSDFTVKSCAVADGGALTYPRLIVGQPFSRLWHKQDDVFKLPQSQVYLFLYSKSTLDDPSAIVLAELFGAYVADGGFFPLVLFPAVAPLLRAVSIISALNEVVYMASTVNLSCSIAVGGAHLTSCASFAWVSTCCVSQGRARTGLEVTCSGFNHKLPDLMRTVRLCCRVHRCRLQLISLVCMRVR